MEEQDHQQYQERENREFRSPEEFCMKLQEVILWYYSYIPLTTSIRGYQEINHLKKAVHPVASEP
jgi:hypothetical protein